MQGVVYELNCEVLNLSAVAIYWAVQLMYFKDMLPIYCTKLWLNQGNTTLVSCTTYYKCAMLQSCEPRTLFVTGTYRLEIIGVHSKRVWSVAFTYFVLKSDRFC